MDDTPAEQPQAPEPTHDLLLSSGVSIPHHGAVPTHYHDGDTGEVLQVIGVTERKRA